MIIEIGIGFICTGLIIFLIRLPGILKKSKDKKESERIEEESERIEEERIRNLKRTIIENIPKEETKHIEEIEKPKEDIEWEEVEKESDDIIPIPKRFLDLIGTTEEFTGYLFSEEEYYEGFTGFEVLEVRWGNIEICDEETMKPIHPTVDLLLKRASMRGALWATGFPVEEINL